MADDIPKHYDFERYRKNYLGSSVQTSNDKKELNSQLQARLNSGKEEWNKWASTFDKYLSNRNIEDYIFNFSELNNFQSIKSFAGYIFPIQSRFRRLNSNADFSNAKFLNGFKISSNEAGNYIFQYVDFFGKTDFSGMSANGPSAASFYFSGSKFHGNTNFSGGVFNKLKIDNCEFIDHIPDFRYCKIQNEINFLNTSIPEEGEVDYDTVLKYRKLKELAIKSSDHEHELKFFACELRADRKLKLQLKQESKLLKYFLSPKLTLDYLYDNFSNYGRSVARPFLSFLAVLFFSLVMNFCLISSDATNCHQTLSKNAATIQYTIKNSFPIFPLSKVEADEIRNCIFGSSMPPLSAKFFSSIQLLLSTIFLFLMGLGLRNRFKIK